jgi:nucleotidyltransferase/DNA polymerase involved in DNA repair
MRFACVFIHRFSTQVERVGKAWDKPLIIGGFPFEKKPVYEASIEAIECGVKLGMPLSEAYVLCPEAKFMPLDEKKYQKAYEQVVQILEGFSPSVEPGGLGCAFLDVAGFEDEVALTNEITASLFHYTSLRACLGIAGNKFLARIAAYVTKSEAPIIVPKGEEMSFLAPLSVNFLPCSEEIKQRLNLLGIRTIGQLSCFSKEALMEQFGKEGTVVYEIAQGIDRTPLLPRARQKLVSERVQFDTPINGLWELLVVIDTVLDRLLAELRAKGRVCRKIRLRINFSTTSEEVTLRLKEATSCNRRMMARLRSWFEKAMFPAAIDGIDIHLEVNQDPGKQLSLVKNDNIRTERLAALRGLGLKKVKIIERDTLIPEHGFRLTEIWE